MFKENYKKKEIGVLFWDISICIILGKLIDLWIGLSDKFMYVFFFFFIGGYDILKGIVVLLNFYVIYWDFYYWKNFELFDLLCFFKKDGILNVKLDSYFFFFVGCWVCLGEFVVKFELFLMCVILL